MRVAGTAVFIIGRYNCENQLHESSRCVDYASSTCLCNDFITLAVSLGAVLVLYGTSFVESVFVSWHLFVIQSTPNLQLNARSNSAI